MFLLAAFAPGRAAEQLNQQDVFKIVQQAASEASRTDPNAIIAVTDREGFLLALWDVKGRIFSPVPPFLPPPFPKVIPRVPSLVTANFKLYSLFGGAITRASTAAFLSSNQEALTSRTAGYIIQQHFPVGVRDSSNGPLVGVGLSSLFFTDVNRVKLIPPGFDGTALVSPVTSPGVRAPLLVPTTLNDSPGGVPLYKNDELVGGIGVTGDGSPTDLAPAGAIVFKESQNKYTSGFKSGHDTDEDVAIAGQTGYRPSNSIIATNILIGGIRIPYIYKNASDIKDVKDVKSLSTLGHAVDIPIPGSLAVASGTPQASPEPYPYERTKLGGVDGEIRFPIRDDPLINVPGRSGVGGRAARLSAAEVRSILSKSATQADKTRAGIRLPVGTPSKNFIAVVNNPEKAGEAPAILGVFRTGEATIFSWDVAVQKARTAVFFSNSQLAMSSRTVGFLAERYFPPGIDGNPPGPFFGFQEAVSLKRDPVHQFFPGDSNLPNGITIFPGGFPLYRHGQLIGAIGVSGDGIDQDDIIAVAGTVDFLPSTNIRADHYTYHNARLPYAKFPRDPDIH